MARLSELQQGFHNVVSNKHKRLGMLLHHARAFGLTARSTLVPELGLVSAGNAEQAMRRRLQAFRSVHT